MERLSFIATSLPIVVPLLAVCAHLPLIIPSLNIGTTCLCEIPALAFLESRMPCDMFQ